MIKQWIKQAFSSKVDADKSSYPKGQAVYNGKPTDYTRLSPYGLDSNPPKWSSILLLQSLGQEAVKFGIVSDFVHRKKNLKEGEVALYNTKTGSFVFIKEDGGIRLQNSAGYIELKADGDTDISGNLNMINGIITGPNVFNGSTSSAHIHDQGNDSNGDTEVDTGVPK